MKKRMIAVLCISILLMTPIINGVSAANVFLTSDNLFAQQGEEVKMLNEIKKYIEEDSNGQITATVDPEAPGPAEGDRLMSSSSDVGVNIAFPCAGNLYELAKYSSKVDKQVIFVNVGNIDLNNQDLLRRAWDDNWSYEEFASVKNPGNLLKTAGISIIQPTQEYPHNTDSDGDMYYSDSEKNKYIADQIISAVNSYSSSDKTLDSSLINEHQLNVSTVGKLSSAIAGTVGNPTEENYGEYTNAQAMYLLASYIAGEGLKTPQEYKAPDNPQNYSINTEGTYSYTDYMGMAEEVVKYMNDNGQAPDFIEYDGAQIGYYDLLYNFASLTIDDTDKSHMDLPKTMDFKTENNNTLLIISIPILIAIAIVLLIVGIKRRNRRY